MKSETEDECAVIFLILKKIVQETLEEKAVARS